MRKELFVEGEYYHIYNRGVDKRPIFMNDSDRLRFVNSLYILNNFLDIPYRFNIYKLEPESSLHKIDPYVKIVAGCLMTNHYHLLITPLKERGMSTFLHKIGTSYTKYFNIKHERSGRLFQSTFRAKLVDSDEYASYLTQYIHLNPLEMFQAKLGTKEAVRKLEEYPWSSLPDYLGNKGHFTKAISLDFRDEVLGMSENDFRIFFNDLAMCQA